MCAPLNFLVTVKAAPHEYIIRSGLIQGLMLKMSICLLFNINIDADSVDLDQTAPIGTG